ncbi:MAG TPA: lipid-A-disaccharide synthase [Gemmatimonadaceae bacterium]
MAEVFFVAGEASGDLHAAGVVAELRARRTDIDVAGIGGPKMEEAGARLMARYEDLAVMGFVEVIRHIPRHLALLSRVRRRLEEGKIRLVVLVDYPGFNMKVAAAAKDAKVPVLYYVTPQVWAWGAGRLPRLAELITRAAVILPFEEPLLRGYGIDATFVGHPLLDRARDLPSQVEARKTLGLVPDRPVLALFPGSREQEIEMHLDDFVAAARIVEAEIPGLQVIVSGAPTVSISQARCPFRVVSASSFPILRAADAALCKSGTTTLEAAIAGCPLAVAYRTGWLSYELARLLVRIPRIGLVNVVAGREVAREFVQNDLRPDRVAPELLRLLDLSSPERARILEGLSEVREKLGAPGASRRVAEMASGLVA